MKTNRLTPATVPEAPSESVDPKAKPKQTKGKTKGVAKHDKEADMAPDIEQKECRVSYETIFKMGEEMGCKPPVVIADLSDPRYLSPAISAIQDAVHKTEVGERGCFLDEAMYWFASLPDAVRMLCDTGEEGCVLAGKYLEAFPGEAGYSLTLGWRRLCLSVAHGTGAKEVLYFTYRDPLFSLVLGTDTPRPVTIPAHLWDGTTVELTGKTFGEALRKARLAVVAYGGGIDMFDATYGPDTSIAEFSLDFTFCDKNDRLLEVLCKEYGPYRSEVEEVWEVLRAAGTYRIPDLINDLLSHGECESQPPEGST